MASSKFWICVCAAEQVWGQIHWNVFKYKYFSLGQIQIHSFVNLFKYNYFWMYFKYKYFSNEKNKFIVFLCFLFWYTHYITSQHQLDEERWDFLIGFTHKMFHIILWSFRIILHIIEDNLPLIDKEAIKSHYIKISVIAIPYDHREKTIPSWLCVQFSDQIISWNKSCWWQNIQIKTWNNLSILMYLKMYLKNQILCKSI